MDSESQELFIFTIYILGNVLLNQQLHTYLEKPPVVQAEVDIPEYEETEF